MKDKKCIICEKEASGIIDGDYLCRDCYYRVRKEKSKEFKLWD